MQTVIVNGQSVTPSKVVCIGRNYVAHIEELGNEIPDQMVVFNKPNSAISNTLYSSLDEPLHYEGELAFVVKSGKLAAVGFGLDLTKRTLQSKLKEKGLPWERAKAFDGAALFSEFVPLPSGVDELSLRLTIDNELRQAGGVSLMMYKPQTILQELAKFTTLEDGDIIMTGTPKGVGVVNAGECFKGQVLTGKEVLISTSWIAK
ncbi:MAG: fumarylacetoacetate hydrolase family protein [Proteobacteria bacterium]|nr:fumarylacetoacetate hydrolase family protein [Pseudomonadota bacterium]